MSVGIIKKKSELEPVIQETKASKTSNPVTGNTNPGKGRSAPVYDSYQGSSPSLKVINTDKPAEVTVQKVEEPKTEFKTELSDFTQELLLDSWKSFSQQIENEMPRLYQVIASHQPQKISNQAIMLHLDNASQYKDFMEKVQSRILAFLKLELKTSILELKVEISEDNVEQQVIYTAGDKYNYLAEQNTLLNDLKKNFNLDFE